MKRSERQETYNCNVEFVFTSYVLHTHWRIVSYTNIHYSKFQKGKQFLSIFIMVFVFIFLFQSGYIAKINKL